jgi:HEPN domain-containing protein
MRQQVVEKALKAVIAKNGAFPPKTHNLMRLVNLAALSDLLSEERSRLIDELYP